MNKKIRFLIILPIVLFAAFVIYFFGEEYIRNYLSRAKLANFSRIPSGSRVLVIAPHCDDETLSSGELISRMVKKGVNFKVVLMTNGDGFTDAAYAAYHETYLESGDFIKLGYLRQGETRDALTFLGLKEKDIIFLGYPDGGLYTMWNQDNWSSTYTSIHTGQNKSPYNNSYTKNTPYMGKSVVKDLSEIISSYKPDYIFYPHPNDRHPDHLASYCFTKYTLNLLGLRPHEYVYLVHRGDWPVITKNSKNLYLNPPTSLMYGYSNWIGFDLSARETGQKWEAISKYSSQVRVMGPRLLAFARKNELFAEYKDGTIRTDWNVNNSVYKSYLLTSDPISDIFLATIQGSGDLKALYGYRNTAGDLKFFLEMRDDVNSEVHYTLDMIMLRNSIETGRLTLNMKEGKHTITLTAQDKSRDIDGTLCTVNGKIIELTLPQEYQAGCDRLFIGAVTSIYKVRLDNIAWRMYNIK